MTPCTFRVRARQALSDARLRRAVRVATERTMAARSQAMAELAEMAADGWACADFETLRRQARAIKQEAIGNLDRYLLQAAEAIQARGGHVHRATRAEEVASILTAIAARRQIGLVVKSKSMATEEIHLNAALQRAGMEVVETDLGEFIVQLAGDRPSHIVMPVIHKSRQEVAELFGRLVGRPVATDTPSLTAVARQVLREKFLTAGMGVSGANFVVAETGTLVVATNEGNGRMVTSLPPVHVAVVGVEKIIPRLADLPVFLQLLARSATGQKLTAYTHLITGPRRPGEADGPEELHVIFLDNGRLPMRQSPYRDMLHCIRCGACLNHCPVYQQVGGHPYGSVYSGPMGVVLTPQLAGLAAWAALPVEACTLCGACTEVCPVGIPLHDLILQERADVVRQGLDESGLRLPLKVAARLWNWPGGFRLSLKLGRMVLRRLRLSRSGSASVLPGPLANWVSGRDLPEPPPMSFHELWARRSRTGPDRASDPAPATGPPTPGPAARPAARSEPAAAGSVASAARGASPGASTVRSPAELRTRLARELQRLGVQILEASDAHRVAGYIASLAAAGKPGDGSVLLWDDPVLERLRVQSALQAAGIPVHRIPAPPGAAERASVGVTGADLAIAASGTLLLRSGPGRGRAVSLLPWVHVAVVEERALVATLEEAFARLGEPLPSSAVLITGPSRSADIENDLSVGVHGPGEVHVVLLTG